MNFPIIQQHSDLIQAVDAKELYEKLGLHAANWKRWHVSNIKANPFATEGVDYQGFIMMMSGNETQNYLLSIDFAKKLSMQVKTKKGEQVRNYFLDCEQRAQQPAIALPHDYISALEELLVTKKSEQVALEQVKELQPKADALDAISHIKGALGIRETAKAVGIPERDFITRCLGLDKPISSRFLYRDDNGKLNAYSHRIKQGFMSQKITSYQGKNGLDFATIQVKFTAAGVTHIAKLMQVKPVNQLRVI